MVRPLLRVGLVPAVALLAACGGSVPPPAPSGAAPPGSASQASPAAEQCFATANAVRTRSSGEPAKVSVKHVLVKFKGAKNAAPDIARSREEACLRAVEVRDKLRGGADFEAMVKEYSDEKGAASRAGSLGSVERGDLAKPFADAAFELSVHEMSDVVETDFGFHVIYRTE
jgi:parvulin-like peptidyl-prolyl isomerase